MSSFAALRAPADVLFGCEQRHNLGAVAAQLGTRALVCTDAHLGGQPAVTAMIDDLSANGVVPAVYADTAPELPRQQVVECVREARAHRPDVVIGIGGGSCLDMAKAAAVVLTHGGEPANYYGDFRVPGHVMPIIAVPTTAGTGSEVTPVAVLTDPDRIMKVGMSSPYLIPSAAICDPELTISCPPAVTASAGADALAHALEAFTAIKPAQDPRHHRTRVFVGKGELTDQFALLAMRYVAAGLRPAFQQPENITARERMMLAALAAGLAFGTAGTAGAHALQYPIGALTSAPHGIGVGTLLPYVMEYNRRERSAELATVARTMGWSGPHTDDEGTRTAADGDLSVVAIDGVAALLASVGVPTSLAELGMPHNRIGWAAEQAMSATRLIANNPRPLSVQAAERILHAAWNGNRLDLRTEPSTWLPPTSSGGTTMPEESAR